MPTADAPPIPRPRTRRWRARRPAPRSARTAGPTPPEALSGGHDGDCDRGGAPAPGFWTFLRAALELSAAR